MPFSHEDVHVLPLTTRGSLIRGQESSSKPDDSDDEVSANHKGVTVHVNKHHDDSDGPVAPVLIVGIVFTFIYLIVKAVVNSYNRNRQAPPPPANYGGGLSQEEVAILQKLQRTLSQMESRVEALETILIDQARTEKNYGSKF